MAVGYKGIPSVWPVRGFRLGTACAGIRQPERRDLVVMEIAEGASVAATFTRNAFCAAPVNLAREHLARAAPRYLLVNTGNANAGTGAQGMRDARRSCQALADLAGCHTQEVLPFSTGVIGEPLPMERLLAGIPRALDVCADDGWEDAAHGILTTDTVPKLASRQLRISGQTVNFTGMAKGSGMIHPDMATMLAFIATDAPVAQDLLQRCLEQAVHVSFNAVTVDGDTSTNDACVLVATGQAPGLATIDKADSECFQQFCAVIRDLCLELAQAIVRDGEGATKFIAVEVDGGADEAECRQVAFTIAHSPLVKTAFFASDPNWGRILAAVGRAGLEDLALDRVTIHLGDVCIVREGGRAADYTEERGQAVMDQDEITVRVSLGRGPASATVWTTDLSHEYVRINAEYRT